MSAPSVPSYAFHDRFNATQDSDADASYSSQHQHQSSADSHRATLEPAPSSLPDFPEFKGFDNDQQLFQSNYFEQFAPKITTPAASFEPQSAQIEHSTPVDDSRILEQSQDSRHSSLQQDQVAASAPTEQVLSVHEHPAVLMPALQPVMSNDSGHSMPHSEPHISSADSYVSPPPIHQHLPLSPSASNQSHPNAGNPLPRPPAMPQSPHSSALHTSSSPTPSHQPASVNGHRTEPTSLQAPFVFPPRPPQTSTESTRSPQQPDLNPYASQMHSDTLPLDKMQIKDHDHVQHSSTNPGNENVVQPMSNSFFGNERPSAAINTSGQQVPVPRSMMADDDDFFQHHDLTRPLSNAPQFFPNGLHQSQPHPHAREDHQPQIARPSSFFGGDNDDAFKPPSHFDPTSPIEHNAANADHSYPQSEPAYRGISTAAGGTGNGPMPAAIGALGGAGSSASTRPASIAPSTTSGPLLDHSHLKVGQKASLLSHGKTLELYRQNAKKTNDPNLIYELAVFMIDAAKTIDKEEEAPTGATPGPAPKVESQKDELIKEATGLLKKIADRGHPDGQYFLGDCYANGVGTKTGRQDFGQAYTYFVLAAKHGHPDAAYRAGTCFEKGWGCRKDAAKALQFFKKAAAQSHPGAMYRLATAELNGELGLKKNAKEGVKWLKRSAETATPEFPHALHELALLHERGIDNVLFVDPEYSCELLAQAGEMGYAPSAYKLGVNYEYGRMGCPQDGGLSIHMYNIAAQQNHKEACFALTAWYLVGAPGILPQSDTEAYLWAKKAAEQQLAKAEYAVGYFTEMGIGTIRDLAEAKAWYKRAADHGDKRASQRVAALQGRAANLQQPAGINRQQQRLEQRQEQRDSMLEFGRRGQPTSAPFPGQFAQSSMTPSTATNYPSPLAMRDAQTAMREQQYLANVAANERAQARAMLRHSPSHGELAQQQTMSPPRSKPMPRPPQQGQHQQQQHQQQHGREASYPSYSANPIAPPPGVQGAPTFAAPPPGPVGHVTMQPAPPHQPIDHHAIGNHNTPDQSTATDDKKKKKWFGRS